MAYVTSESTIAQIRAAIQDNASYDVDNDTTKCKEFIVACRAYLAKAAEEMESGGDRVREDLGKVEARLEKAEAWWSANDTDATTTAQGGTRYFSFENFR